MGAPAWLRRLPVVVAMGLLLLPWVTLAVGRAGWDLIPQPVLSGMETAVPNPVLDGWGVWSGSYQKAFTAYFGRALPVLADAVLLKNQIYYTLLHQSGVEAVVIGKHRQLYEPVYVAEYCDRNIAAIHDRAEGWAARLARLQEWYAAQGKVFVYLMTPSKAATYPQYLPTNIPCYARPADQLGFDAAWRRVLDAHGVRYVDGAAITRDARGQYPFEMFPLGGTHWNDVAAALTTHAVVRQIDAAPMRWKLAPFTFRWTMVKPFFVALDLTNLINVPWPRLDFPVPVVELVAPAPVACAPVQIGFVGGSFSYEVMWLLEKLPCAPTIDFYSYFSLEHTVFPGDVRTPVDPAQRQAALLQRADVVILEENESAMIRSYHGPTFYGLAEMVFGEP
jgi:alginate O-acetyltransferase complex protein AlgJ